MRIDTKKAAHGRTANAIEMIIPSRSFDSRTIIIVSVLLCRLALHVVGIYVEMRLSGFAYAVCSEINAPTNQTADENVSKRPTVCGLFEDYILVASGLRLHIDALTIEFVTLYLHDAGKIHVGIGLFRGRDGHRLADVSINRDFWTATRNNGSTG